MLGSLDHIFYTEGLYLGFFDEYQQLDVRGTLGISGLNVFGLPGYLLHSLLVRWSSVASLSSSR
jgi:hypothetical protein